MSVSTVIRVIPLALIATPIFAQQPPVVAPRSCPMAGWPWWMFPLGMVMVLVFFVIVGTVLCRVMRHHRHGPFCGPSTGAADTRQILRERLARGEITAEEFDALVDKLASS